MRNINATARHESVEDLTGSGLTLSTWMIAAVYPGLLAGAELTVAYISAPLGAVVHAALVVMLLGQFLYAGWSEHDKLVRMLPVFALLPMLRVVSLAMPLDAVSWIYWHAWVGVPMLLAALLLARTLRISWSRVGLDPRHRLAQAGLTAGGGALGLLAFAIHQPAPLDTEITPVDAVLVAAGLVLFSAVLEEVVFRAMLLPLAVHLFGTAGVVWSGVLFGIMYLGAHSPAMLLLMMGVGTLFGFYVHRTGSIWGAIFAHSAFKIGLLLVFPALL